MLAADNDRYEIEPYADITDVWVLNSSFKKIGLIDDYTSLIWSRRYWEVGDFELYVQATEENMSLLSIDPASTQLFIMRADNGEVMAVETVEITVDPEEGNFITVSGRDLRKFLYQRVTTLTRSYGQAFDSPINEGTVESQRYNVCRAIYDMVKLECTNPSDTKRKIPYLQSSTQEVEGCDISAITIDAATNVGEKAEELCTDFRIGWKCEWEEKNSRMYLQCYEGADRTSYVIFSEEFCNLEGLTQTDTTRDDYYNAMILATKDENEMETISQFGDTESSGFTRFEKGFTGSGDMDVDTSVELRELLYTYKLPTSYNVHYDYYVFHEGQGDDSGYYTRVSQDPSGSNPQDVDEETGEARTGNDYMSSTNPLIIITHADFYHDGWFSENDDWEASVSFLKYEFRAYDDEHLAYLKDYFENQGEVVTKNGATYYVMDGTNDPAKRVEIGTGKIRREYGWGSKDEYKYPWNLTVPAEYSGDGKAQTDFANLDASPTTNNQMERQLPLNMRIQLNPVFIQDRQMAYAYSMVEEPMPTGEFEGHVIPFVQYRYRKDYDIGDKVMLKTRLGIKKAVRITEAVETFDRDGYNVEVKFSN